MSMVLCRCPGRAGLVTIGVCFLTVPLSLQAGVVQDGRSGVPRAACLPVPNTGGQAASGTHALTRPVAAELTERSGTLVTPDLVLGGLALDQLSIRAWRLTRLDVPIDIAALLEAPAGAPGRNSSRHDRTTDDPVREHIGWVGSSSLDSDRTSDVTIGVIPEPTVLLLMLVGLPVVVRRRSRPLGPRRIRLRV